VREGFFPSGDAVAVGIDADSRVARESAPAQGFVEEDASGRVDRRMDARRDHVNADTGVENGIDESASSDIAAAAPTHI